MISDTCCFSHFPFLFIYFSGRFINERIESVVLCTTKVNKGASAGQEVYHPKEDGLLISSDRISKLSDPSVTGVELVQIRNGHSRNAQSSTKDNISKDPLLSIDAQLSCSWNSLPSNSQINDDRGIQQYHSGGQWGDILDLMSQRKTLALAPEHFENVWTKGRNYKKLDGMIKSIEQVPQRIMVRNSPRNDHVTLRSRLKETETNPKLNPSKGSNGNLRSSSRFARENMSFCADRRSTCPSIASFQDDEQGHMDLQTVDSGSSTSYTSEDDETSSITSLDSPLTRVWDGSNRNQTVSHIRHPLENFDGHSTKKMNKRNSRRKRLGRAQFGWKRYASADHNMHTWQEVKRTSFLSGDGQDILNSPKSHVISEDSNDDADIDNLGRVHSGAEASSSSASSVPISASCSSVVNPQKSSLAVDSFFKLRCEVLILIICGPFN